MVLNATFNNISVISWQSVLLIKYKIYTFGNGLKSPKKENRNRKLHWILSLL